MRRRRMILGIVGAAAIGFIGCGGQTDPATQPSPTSFVPNGHGHCDGVETGVWSWQVRDVTAGGSFAQAGPWKNVNCTQATPDGDLNPNDADGYERINGLPGHTYQFRINAVRQTGGGISGGTVDSVGTVNGTNYDSVTLPTYESLPVAYDASNDPPTMTVCDNGATSCAASAQKKCKGRNGTPLRNKYTHTQYGVLTEWGKVDSDWCWRNGKVVERHSFGDGDVSGYTRLQGWYMVKEGFVYSACTADQSSCLTRYQQDTRCCTYLPDRVRFSLGRHCIGTRVCAYSCNPTGAFHSRNIIHGRCP